MCSGGRVKTGENLTPRRPPARRAASTLHESHGEEIVYSDQPQVALSSFDEPAAQLQPAGDEIEVSDDEAPDDKDFVKAAHNLKDRLKKTKSALRKRTTKAQEEAQANEGHESWNERLKQNDIDRRILDELEYAGKDLSRVCEAHSSERSRAPVDQDDEESKPQGYECVQPYIEERKEEMRVNGELPLSSFTDLHQTAEARHRYHEQGDTPFRRLAHEVTTFQDTMKEKLDRLEGSSSHRSLKKTIDPAEAVREGVLNYHRTCETVGRLYAVPSDADERSLDPAQQKEVRRLIQQLE